MLRFVVICVIVGIGTCQKPRFAIKRTSSNLLNAKIHPFYHPYFPEKTLVRRPRQPDVPQYISTVGGGFNPTDYYTGFQRRGGPSPGRSKDHALFVPHEEKNPIMFTDPPNFRSRETPFCAVNNSLPMPCERDGEYDEGIIKQMERVLRTTNVNSIKDNDVLIHLINETALAKQEGKDIFIPKEPEFRLPGNFIEESPACRALESIIYPQRAMTRDNDWVFVVNQNIMRQGVRVEKCLSESNPCSLDNDLPPTIKTTCRQKFIYRKLLVLTKEGTDILPETVLMPSCCVCYVIRSSQVLSPRKNGKGFNSTQGPDTTSTEPIPDTTESAGKVIGFN